MKITIVGQESPPQKQLLQYVLDSLHELQLECQLGVVHDLKEILDIETKKLIITPALIVDNHILCEGNIWSKEHIKHFLQYACRQNAKT